MPHQVFVRVTGNGVVVVAFRGEVEIGFPEGGAGGGRVPGGSKSAVLPIERRWQPREECRATQFR